MTAVDKKRRRVGKRSKQAPRDVLYDMYRAYSITQALYVVAKLGVADYLRDALLGATSSGRRLVPIPGPSSV